MAIKHISVVQATYQKAKVAVVINGRFPAAAEDVRSILERSPKIVLTIEAASGRTSEDKEKVGK